jgi:hypothetical protein
MNINIIWEDLTIGILPDGNIIKYTESMIELEDNLQKIYKTNNFNITETFK